MAKSGSIPALSLQPEGVGACHISLGFHHSSWPGGRIRHGRCKRVNFLIEITSSLSPVSPGHTEQCLRRLLHVPPKPNSLSLATLGGRCLMTLSGRIRPRTSTMAEQEHKNSDCPWPFPGPWRVLQFNRELRRHEALMSQCFRSLSCLHNVTLSLQRPRTQNPLLGGLSGWAHPVRGFARRHDCCRNW